MPCIVHTRLVDCHAYLCLHDDILFTGFRLGGFVALDILFMMALKVLRIKHIQVVAGSEFRRLDSSS